MMKPCVPPDVQARAEAASRRKDEALDRLLSMVSAVGDPPGAEFENAMGAIVDTDKRALAAMAARRKS